MIKPTVAVFLFCQFYRFHVEFIIFYILFYISLFLYEFYFFFNFYFVESAHKLPNVHLETPSSFMKENRNTQPSFQRLQPQAERPAIKRPVLQLGQTIPTGDVESFADDSDFLGNDFLGNAETTLFAFFG